MIVGVLGPVVRAVAVVWVISGLAEAQEPDGGAAASVPEPVTTRDVRIPLAELELIVKPLTVEELEVEAVAWFELLRAKAHEIAAAELGVRRARTAADLVDEQGTQAAVETVQEVVESAETAASETSEVETAVGVDAGTDEEEAAPDAASGTDEDQTPPEPVELSETASPEEVGQAAGQVRQQLLDQAAELRSEQTAVSDRLDVVLDSLEAKGGQVDAYRQFISAVSTIDVDVSDAGATWATVTGWLVADEGGVRWLWNLVSFVLAVGATWLAARLLGGAVKRVGRRTGSMVSTLAKDAIARSLKSAVWVVGLVVALSMLEVDITPLLAAIGAAGLVIGLALQGTLSNVASGVMILLNRPFDVGDVVTVAGVSGTVKEMSLVNVLITTFDNQSVLVPNNSIWGDVITNVTANRVRRVDMVFGIGYGDDIGKATGILEAVVRGHALVLDDPPPLIKLHELGDSSVNFIVRPWSRTSDYWTVYWDVTRAVKERFDAEGVSIPFPQRDVHLYTEEAGQAGVEHDSAVAELSTSGELAAPRDAR